MAGPACCRRAQRASGGQLEMWSILRPRCMHTLQHAEDLIYSCLTAVERCIRTITVGVKTTLH